MIPDGSLLVGCLSMSMSMSMSMCMPTDSVILAPALVTKTIVQSSGDLVELRTDDGEVVVSSPEHPFALARSPGRARSGWSRADRLEVGDSLVRLSPAGATTEVVSVNRRHGSPAPVFNLVVFRVHAYAVGRSRLLVHNGKCKTPEELAAEDQRLEELIAERDRLIKEGDPDNLLRGINAEIGKLKDRQRKRAGNFGSARRAEVLRRKREVSAARRASNPGADAAWKRAYLAAHPESRVEGNKRRREKLRQDAEYRARVRKQERDRRRLKKLIERLEHDTADKGHETIPDAAVQRRIDELAALLRGPAEAGEPLGTELEAAVAGDLRGLERQLESPAGLEAGATSDLGRDLALEKSSFDESLAAVEARMEAYDSMSEEVAAYFPGMREELMTEERTLVDQRRQQIQVEIQATDYQLKLMMDIPEFHDAGAQSELQQQIEALKAELGSLPEAPA